MQGIRFLPLIVANFGGSQHRIRRRRILCRRTSGGLQLARCLTAVGDGRAPGNV